MPELPEVEMVRRVLGPQLAGKSICAARLITPGIIAHPEAEEFVAGVVGRCIAGMERRGKFLQILLDDGGRIVVHFRMTGCLLRFAASDLSGKNERGEAFASAGKSEYGEEAESSRRGEHGEAVGSVKNDVYAGLANVMEKHTHVIFELDDGSALCYSDQRRFGRLWLVEDVMSEVEAAEREMSAAGLCVTGMDKLGPEPFDTGLSWKYLRDKLGNRRISIKEGLLDQGVVAGIGNIYSDEILFASRIYPGQEARTLTVAQWKRLAAQIPVTMKYYIGKNDISPEDYLKGRGKDYRNTPYLKVYGHKEAPCPNCRTRLESMRIGGRSSVYCPKCQKG